MLCDICNARVTKEDAVILPIADARVLIAAGWGIDGTNIGMLTSGGMPRETAIAMLRAGYLQSQSDWCLCPGCAESAYHFKRQHLRAAHVDVSAVANEAGFACPVLLAQEVWDRCVRWDDSDNELQDVFQQQDARLWDVLFVASCKLQLDPGIIFAPGGFCYQIYCVLRDGRSTEAVLIQLRARPHKIGTTAAIAVEFADFHPLDG